MARQRRQGTDGTEVRAVTVGRADAAPCTPPSRTETAVADRHMSIVDAHMILRRDGKILLLRRAGNVYASGQLCLPSGHHEAGESVTATAARETAEETGITLQPSSLRMVLAMHQRNPTARRDSGSSSNQITGKESPVNRESRKHSELIWADPARLPPDTVDYAAKAITAIEQGCTFTLNGWDPPAAQTRSAAYPPPPDAGSRVRAPSSQHQVTQRHPVRQRNLPK